MLELAGITAQTRWLTVFAPQVKNALQQYPLIVSASVRHERNNQIVIEIEEREPVGYRYIEEPEILFKDGTVVKMDERMTGLIARIPLIVGFQSGGTERRSGDGVPACARSDDFADFQRSSNMRFPTIPT